MSLKVIPLAAIKIGSVKTDADHVKALAESFAEVDLLEPLLVNEDYELVAGAHRFRAAKLAGLEKVPVHVLDLDETGQRMAQLDENLLQKQRPALELAELMRERKELYEAAHPEAKKGGDPKKRQSDKKSVRAFTADVAKKTGQTDRNVRRYVEVAEKLDPKVKKLIAATEAANRISDLQRLAKLSPEQQREVAAQLAESSTMSTKQAERKVRMRTQVEQARTYKPPAGKFAVIVADPPWEYDDELNGSLNRALPYPTMKLEEICALQVPAADTCALFLWVTKSHLLDGSAAKVLAAWGFTAKSMITWVKSNIGLGRYVRNRCEFVIVAVKGSPAFDLEGDTGLKDDVIIQTGPRLEHSRKPEELFRRVEALCPSTSRLELFARAERPGWVTSGSELQQRPPMFIETEAGRRIAATLSVGMEKTGNKARRENMRVRDVVAP